MATSDELWRASQVIVDGDRRDYAHALHTDAPWPRPFDTWFGGDYPVARGQQPHQKGWVCAGCGRGLAPCVRECPHCPESRKAMDPRGALCDCEECQ